jgi:hypothetical protein
VINNSRVLDDIAFKIYELQGPERIKDLSHLKMAFKNADKELFQKFRDGIISYD